MKWLFWLSFALNLVFLTSLFNYALRVKIYRVVWWAGVPKVYRWLDDIGLNLTGSHHAPKKHRQAKPRTQNKSSKSDSGNSAEVKVNEKGYDIEKVIYNQKPSFKELIYFPDDYIGKTLTLYGWASKDYYYAWGFSGEEKRYYSVELRDGKFSTVHIYFPKNQRNAKLVRTLEKVGELPIKVSAVLKRERFNKKMIGEDFVAEGLSWEVME